MKMTIKQRRVEKGWSQLQLAEFSGVSLRTVQRLEKGHRPTTETLKSVAAVFEIDFQELIDNQQSQAIDESSLSELEKQELERIRKQQGFIRDLLIFATLIPLAFLASFTGILSLRTVLLGLLGWATYFVWEAFNVFEAKDFFDKDWEKRVLEKRIGRKVD